MRTQNRTEPSGELAHFHETTGTRRQGCYRLTRYYRRNGQTFRVRIYRDSVEDQSHAVAEVLTPGLTWTGIVDNPPSNWHGKTSLWGEKPTQVNPDPGFTTLARLANALARDAIAIVVA